MEFKASDAESCCAQPCDETCNPYEDNRALYQAYQVLIAGKVLQVFFNWLNFLSNYEDVGILIIMVKRMGTDVATFMGARPPAHPAAPAPPHASVRVAAGRDERPHLSLRGSMAPALRRVCALFRPAPLHASPALVRSPVLRCRAGLHGGGGGAGDGAGLYREDEPWDPFAHKGSFWSPLWSTFGVIDVTAYTWVSAPVMWTYSFLCTIGMVNLLVAMFADTFNSVKTDSEIEFQFDECERMFRYRDVVLSTPVRCRRHCRHHGRAAARQASRGHSARPPAHQ